MAHLISGHRSQLSSSVCAFLPGGLWNTILYSTLLSYPTLYCLTQYHARIIYYTIPHTNHVVSAVMIWRIRWVQGAGSNDLRPSSWFLVYNPDLTKIAFPWRLLLHSPHIPGRSAPGPRAPWELSAQNTLRLGGCASNLCTGFASWLLCFTL